MEGRERDTVHHRDGVITTSALPPLENQKKKKSEKKKKRMEEKRSLQIGILREKDVLQFRSFSPFSM